ncbi:MAG: hypothetical protein QNK05_04370 [Myxococcota bacterium]|nr:hypothetical protein [Myxococcota bacterium]
MPAGLGLVLALALAAPAAADSLLFDGAGFPSLSDVAAADTGSVSISSALILSEADLATLTFLPTSGFATSGDQGLLNSLAAGIDIAFGQPVESVSIDVVGLPLVGGTGDHAVALLAFSNGQLILETLSDPTQIGDSGRHEATLSAMAVRIDAVRLEARDCPMGPTSCVLADVTTSFFADTLDFVSAPEPGIVGWLIPVLALGCLGRARGGRS